MSATPSPPESTPATGDSTDFRGAIRALIPRLKALAGAAEQERRLPTESVARLREVGVYRAFVPRVYGGEERALSEFFDAMIDLGTGCPSTAWVSSLLAIHNISACWLEKEGQEEIFEEGPDVLMSSSVAPTGTIAAAPGGFHLSGTWGFSSGVDHASWIMLGASLPSDVRTAPDYFLCFVRASEVGILDDWRVSGLRATGSKSLQLSQVFVPARRALCLRTVQEGTAPGLALHTKPFYRLPWESVFISALPAAALGAALAMLEGFREYTAPRVNRFSGARFSANVGSAMRIAEAAAQVDAVRLLFRRDLASLDELAFHGGSWPAGTAERIAYDVPYIIDSCSRAVLRLFRGSGGRAIYETSALQRHFRDIHAMTQHAAADADGAWESYGRKLFENRALSFGAWK
jgi:alkylation response protein AidB-like acyl-CoA dehydrogenase